MAKDASEGVADEFGRVFGYDGLYIADASLIPSSLGVNPSLTISALSLRIAYQMIKDHYSA
jgi:cholesterol oxidase